jgi:hypothetical protein
VNHRSHSPSRRIWVAALLAIVAFSTVALSEELFVTEALQPGAVLDVGGQLLTGTDYRSLVTVGEGIVHPYALTGEDLVMRPGYIAITRLMKAQDPIGIEPEQAPVLVDRLDGNFPNPFNPATTIRFSLAGPGPATLRVYDVQGRIVRTLVDEPLTAGEHSVRWDGRTEGGAQAASGVYFMRLQTPGFTDHQKLVMSR